MNKLKKLNIVLWDIETLPHMGCHWGQWKQNISGSQIFQPSAMLCIGYKWLNDPKVYNINPMNEPGFTLDPYAFEGWLAKRFIPIIEKADFAIAHNGDAFDYAKLKAASVMYNLSPFKVRKVDTLKMAKATGLFPKGNSLDSLADVLGIKRKHKMSMDVWMDIALRRQNQLFQMQKMIQYNNRDVEVLEEVFLKLWPHCESILPDVNVLSGGDKNDAKCNRCGSENTNKKGKQIKNVLVYQRYKCKDCGASFLGRTAIDI